MSDYREFIERKSQFGGDHGFAPLWMPSNLFDFQESLVEWSLRKGRCAIFADCGLGKTPMQLTWAENVVRRTNGRVLILAPLAVGAQTVREGEKFGVAVHHSRDGNLAAGVNVTNYEKLHLFAPSDFSGVVCDESSILKNCDGVTRAAVTEFLRKLPYRLLCTATASPNDYVELGTSSEALGELPNLEMLQRFFKNDQNSVQANRLWSGAKWRFKRHAEVPFWMWICSWARAIRKPSDLGFGDGRFVLPRLMESETVVAAKRAFDGYLFQMPAVGLKEQREELRQTLRERCETAAEILSQGSAPGLAWCHLNDEGDLLAELIPDAVQVSGDDTDEAKEEKFAAFASRQARILVTKPKIGGFGLNWQHCARMTFFPSHSYEQYYQAVRRCWRFGQARPVHVSVITTEGGIGVMKNLQRKAEAADKMFSALVSCMNESQKIERARLAAARVEVPEWLQKIS